MIGTTSTSRRRRGLWTLIGVIGMTGGLAACNDNDDITTPTGVVTVVRDQNFAFATLHTFAMPDTVIHFAPLTGAALEVSREFDQAALDEVRQNLLLRGYTQVTNPQTTQPDFVVLVGSTATTDYNAYVSYPWFDVWGFYPGWGWYAPGFSSAWGIAYPWSGEVGVTAYDRGTMVVTIIPTVSVNATSEMVNASWAGVASALLDGTVTSTSVANAVDLMFQKSPYLTATTTSASRTGQ